MPKVKKLRKTAPEREYIVEKITGKRIVDGCVEYSIKWKGYPMSENTWEKEEDCNCSALIREFEASLAKSDGGAQPKVKGPSKKAQAKVTENDPAKGGFNRGLEPEAILGATEQDGKLIFLMKWKGSDAEDLVYADEANLRCPQVVIKFYESKLTWRTPSETETSADEKQ